jgi:drug/metabolite transporter (DMT)-like permease
MEITDDLTTLVRKEVELAKVELQENLQEGAQAGGKVAVGGMVAYAGLLLILAAIAVALGDWWENYWLGAAVVGIITAIIGYVLLNGGLNQLKQVTLVPKKAMASLERDAKMAKEKLS